jgi:putative metallohydrolase (TIGR04338 family)
MGYILRSRPRDEQRKRLYAAENQTEAFLRDPLPKIEQMQAFVDEILRSPWLQGQFGNRMLSPITVVNGRRKRQATAHYFMSAIKIPSALRSKFIVLHEISHILTDRYYGQDATEAHGPQFATFLLLLVDHFLGTEDCEELLEAFARWGVAHSYREQGEIDD